MKNEVQNGKINNLYTVMRKWERRLGGGDGIIGIYGSITQQGFTKIVNSLINNCNLNSESHFLDVGSGLGRPLLHVKLNPGVKSATGLEIDPVKCKKAIAFVKQVLIELRNKQIKYIPENTIETINGNIEDNDINDEYTHSYSFWEGINFESKKAFGRYFTESKKFKAVAVVQRAFRGNPVEKMSELGFLNLILVDSFRVHMTGSNAAFMAYIFCKKYESVDDVKEMETPVKRMECNLVNNLDRDISSVKRRFSVASLVDECEKGKIEIKQTF